MSRSRLLIVVLMLSLAGNVFAVGLGLALANRAPSTMRLVDPVPSELVERVAKLLPAPAGDTLRARFADIDDELAQHLAGYRRSLLEAAVLLDAETVDIAAASRAIAAGLVDRAAVGDQLGRIFVETVAALPLEQRRALVQRFLVQP